MKNVTITLDEELHRRIEFDAARAGMSLSDYVSEVLNAAAQDKRSSREQVETDIQRLRAVYAGPKLDLSQGGRMPSADERNARR